MLMKLRNMIPFCALIAAILSASAAPCTTASSAVSTPPNAVVEEFYKWYIHSVSHQIDPFKAGKSLASHF